MQTVSIRYDRSIPFHCRIVVRAYHINIYYIKSLRTSTEVEVMPDLVGRPTPQDLTFLAVSDWRTRQEDLRGNVRIREDLSRIFTGTRA